MHSHLVKLEVGGEVNDGNDGLVHVLPSDVEAEVDGVEAQQDP